MWDERYDTEEYAYGTEPNDFLKSQVNAIPNGKVLCVAEGEGRNAVYLAKLGYSVTAVDSSSVGLRKAQKLAEENGVEIDFIHSDLAEYEIGVNQWDGIVSVFCPLPPDLRKRLHADAVQGLKKNGVFLLEAYTPEQIKFGTGGGNSIELMQSSYSLRRELEGLEFDHLLEINRKVVEGTYHTGDAAVVQAIARKV